MMRWDAAVVSCGMIHVAATLSRGPAMCIGEGDRPSGMRRVGHFGGQPFVRMAKRTAPDDVVVLGGSTGGVNEHHGGLRFNVAGVQGAGEQVRSGRGLNRVAAKKPTTSWSLGQSWPSPQQGSAGESHAGGVRGCTAPPDNRPTFAQIIRHGQGCSIEVGAVATSRLAHLCRAFPAGFRPSSQPGPAPVS